MKKFIYLIVALNTLFLQAQQSSSCSFISEKNGAVQKFSFTVSRYVKDSAFYNTDYYVYDNNKLPLKVISASNNTREKKITLTLRELKTGSIEDSYVVLYNQFSGLIITENGDSVTQIDKLYYYLYLLSFDSPDKSYVNIYYITKTPDYSVLFNKVTDSLLAKNKDYLKQSYLYKTFLQQQQKQKEEQEAKQREVDSLVDLKIKALKLNQENDATSFKNDSPAKQTPSSSKSVNNSNLSNDSILEAARYFMAKYHADSLAVVAIKNEVNSDIYKYSFNVSESRVDVGNQGDVFYGKGAANREGEGMLIIDNRLIYSGTFLKGQFVAGKVLLKYKNGKTYIGNYANARPKGLGQWTYPNGETEIGNFSEAGLQNGIVRKKEDNGNAYFGQLLLNKKEGFGIYKPLNGNIYMGVFKADVLVNGFSVQTDDVGLKTYFTISEGTKYAIDIKEWDAFNAELQEILKQ